MIHGSMLGMPMSLADITVGREPGPSRSAERSRKRLRPALEGRLPWRARRRCRCSRYGTATGNARGRRAGRAAAPVARSGNGSSQVKATLYWSITVSCGSLPCQVTRGRARENTRSSVPTTSSQKHEVVGVERLAIRPLLAGAQVDGEGMLVVRHAPVRHHVGMYPGAVRGELAERLRRALDHHAGLVLDRDSVPAKAAAILADFVRRAEHRRVGGQAVDHGGQLAAGHARRQHRRLAEGGDRIAGFCHVGAGGRPVVVDVGRAADGLQRHHGACGAVAGTLVFAGGEQRRGGQSPRPARRSEQRNISSRLVPPVEIERPESTTPAPATQRHDLRCLRCLRCGARIDRVLLSSIN